MVLKERTEQIEIWVANDGKEFTSKSECWKHDKNPKTIIKGQFLAFSKEARIDALFSLFNNWDCDCYVSKPKTELDLQALRNFISLCDPCCYECNKDSLKTKETYFIGCDIDNGWISINTADDFVKKVKDRLAEVMEFIDKDDKK